MTTPTSFRCYLVAVFAFILCVLRASAATITVTSAADDGSAGTLRSAIVAAQSGDTITFDPTLNGQVITLNGSPLSINNSIAIRGPGATLLTIDAHQASRVLNIGSGNNIVSLSGLTITNGVSFAGSQNGGGIFNASAGAVTLTDCTLSGNTAFFIGGGIFNSRLGPPHVD